MNNDVRFSFAGPRWAVRRDSFKLTWVSVFGIGVCVRRMVSRSFSSSMEARTLKWLLFTERKKKEAKKKLADKITAFFFLFLQLKIIFSNYYYFFVRFAPCVNVFSTVTNLLAIFTKYLNDMILLLFFCPACVWVFRVSWN